MVPVYAQDGVNTEVGDRLSAFAAACCRSTYSSCRHVTVYDMSRNNFRGPRGFVFRDVPPGSILTPAPDGVGTKVTIDDAAGFHLTTGRNLMAMVSTDISRWGGVPCVISNVLDVSTAEEEGSPTNLACRNLYQSLADAARDNDMVLMNGETAELGECVGSENPNATVKFNWAGFAIGLFHPDKMILGDTLAPGQVVIALQEPGLRSNGISSARKGFKMKFGDNWFTNPDATASIKAAATPSMLYDKFLTAMNGWHTADFQPVIRMNLIVHVTGGALKDKFGKDLLFPAGLSAILDNLFDPPQIMRDVVAWRGMSDFDCFKTFCCGQGVLVVIEEQDVQQFIELAATYGIVAQQCGRITETKGNTPKVDVVSKFTGATISLTADE